MLEAGALNNSKNNDSIETTYNNVKNDPEYIAQFYQLWEKANIDYKNKQIYKSQQIREDYR